MIQHQTETHYIKDQLIGEEMSDHGWIGIAVNRPDLPTVENIENGKIGQIAGMQNQICTAEGMFQNSPEPFVVTPQMRI